MKHLLLAVFFWGCWAGGYAQLQTANSPTGIYVFKVTPNRVKLDTFPSGGGAQGFLANSSISDAQGNLLFFSMGLDVKNKMGDTMDNGCCLCESIDQPLTCQSGSGGSPIFQGALILPKPGSITQYYLFIKDMITIFPNLGFGAPMRVTASLVDLSYNNGLGKVLQRAVPILNDTLSLARMTACRHANGRDWWLVNHKIGYTNKIYTHLITPDSIYGPYIQIIGGNDNYAQFGWSVFSPDGSTFATTTAGMGEITLLDFDRCTGTFSNYRAIPTDSNKLSEFLAFSPNSRFLYSGNNEYLFQYDLLSTNIANSCTMLVNDSIYPPGSSSMVLMPDNKIYRIGWSDPGTNCISVIDSPDLKAPYCNFHLRSLCFTDSARGIHVGIHSLPNFVNYNLGALAGSGCDTLQTDIRQETQDTRQIQIQPNPATDELTVTFNASEKASEISVYDVQGRELQKQKIQQQYTAIQLNIKNLPAGMYYVQVKNEAGIVATAKFVKQ